MASIPKSTAIEKLKRAISCIDDLKRTRRSSPEFEKWLQSTNTALINIFGEQSRQAKDFNSVSYYPLGVYVVGVGMEISESEYQEAFLRGLDKAKFSTGQKMIFETA